MLNDVSAKPEVTQISRDHKAEEMFARLFRKIINFLTSSHTRV